MSQTPIEFYGTGQRLESQPMPAFWWKNTIVLEFLCLAKCTQGYAYGDGYNCLIDTLRQQLQLDVDVSLARSDLEKTYMLSPIAIRV
eukprot:10968400-Karenia_brevis.AAC.1